MIIDFLNKLDTQVFLFLNGMNSPFFDTVMCWISGKYQWLPLYAALVGYIIYKYKWKSLYIFAAVILMIVISDQLASGLIKKLVMRLRPSHEPTLSGLVHIVNDYKGGKYGFVSSHAANSFALAGFLSLLLKSHLRWFPVSIFAWATIVSYSRIYLGVHYPGDIIGGAFVGIFSAAVVWYAYRRVTSYFERANVTMC